MAGCLAVLTMLIVAGCGSAERLVTSPTSDPTSDATGQGVDHNANAPEELPTTAPRRQRREAAQLLRAAKRSLVRDGTGRFTNISSAGDPDGGGSLGSLRVRGMYDLDQLRSRLKMAVLDESGDRRLTIRAITRGRRIFVRIASGGTMWPCWMAVTPNGLAEATGDPVSADLVRFPGEVQGLLRARALTTIPDDPELIVATIPMATAAVLAGPDVNKRLRGQVQGIRVPVEIRIRSGRFVEWSLQGVDVLAAVDDALLALNTEVREALPFVTTSVNLRDLGTPVDVSPPPRSERTRLNEFDPTACGTQIV